MHVKSHQCKDDLGLEGERKRKTEHEGIRQNSMVGVDDGIRESGIGKTAERRLKNLPIASETELQKVEFMRLRIVTRESEVVEFDPE
jgi:hypothetical protein